MDKYWEQRLRRYYQARYDYRKNAADWDYHMKLKTLSAEYVGEGVGDRVRDRHWAWKTTALGKPHEESWCYFMLFWYAEPPLS